jgi:hypothetical protein
MRKIVLPNITLVILQGVLGTLESMENQLKQVFGALRDHTLGDRKPRWGCTAPHREGVIGAVRLDLA